MLNKLRLFKKYYLTPCPYDSLKNCSDFDIKIIPINISNYYYKLKVYVKRIRTCKIKLLSTLKYKDQKYPIYSVDILNNSPGRKFLILTGVHGNETAGLHSVLRLLSLISKDKSLVKDWSVKIITPVNPVGVKYQSRYNPSGCDINRDFRYFKTQEANIQKGIIDQYKPDIIVSLHEGPQDGFHLITSPHVEKELISDILRVLQNNNISLATKHHLGFALKVKGHSTYGKILLKVGRIFGVYPLALYTLSKNIPLITCESPWGSDDYEERIRAHIEVIKSILSS